MKMDREDVVDPGSSPPDDRSPTVDLRPAGSSAELYSATGMEVASVLRAAHDAALEMAQRAEEDAARVRAEAEADAVNIRTAAEEDAKRIRAEEREEVERRRKELEQEFAQARLAAEEDERRNRDEAEGEIFRQQERVRDDMKEALERFSTESLARIRDGIRRIEAEHEELRRTLDGASRWVEKVAAPTIEPGREAESG